MNAVRFAYSFDRERFDGSLDTRQEALKTALSTVPTLENAPEAVFVGKRVPTDPGSSGLAEMLLTAMRRRLREHSGEANSGYLMRVNEHQLAELDDEIDRVVRGWLDKHNFAPTSSRIVAISEHPVPQPQMQQASKNGNEVSELGESNYPISLS